MTVRFALLLGVAIFVFPGVARAQLAPAAPETISVGDWKLAPVAELMLRGEYRHDVDDTDRVMLIERARLGLSASQGALDARVVLEDARALDVVGTAAALGGPPPQANTGAYEAWVEAHTANARPSFVRVGRQAVAWGEGRLLGTNDWSPAGRSLDAVRGRLVAGDADFELLAAALEDPAPLPGGPFAFDAYGELFGARGQWALVPLFAVEAYALIRLAQVTPLDTFDLSVPGETYTGALRLHGRSEAWAWGAEGAYQLGHRDRFAGPREAWAAAAHVAHTFERVELRPTAQIAVAYATGDNGGTTYHEFDPLLPDVHRWHGAMDLLSWSNDEEASARVGCEPWTDGSIAIEYRYARLAEPGGTWRSGYLTPIGRLASNTEAELGHEVDAVVAWAPWLPVEISAGYSAFFIGSGARAILSATGSVPSVSHFAYLQVRLAL
jgi:hypothetical protein